MPCRDLSTGEMGEIERAFEDDSRTPLRKWLDAAWLLLLGACLPGPILFTLIEFLASL